MRGVGFSLPTGTTASRSPIGQSSLSQVDHLIGRLLGEPLESQEDPSPLALLGEQNADSHSSDLVDLTPEMPRRRQSLFSNLRHGRRHLNSVFVGEPVDELLDWPTPRDRPIIAPARPNSY